MDRITKDSEKYRGNKENGNVFFYLLLAIALLSGLVFAVSQGGRGSISQLDSDRRQLVATEIVSFADTVSKTVTQLRLRGAAITELSFANSFLSAADYGTYDNDAPNEIFNPAGGAVVYTAPPEDATTAVVDWQFLANNEIENVGTTNGNASSSDLIMVLPNVRQEVCVTINNIIDITNPGGAPPTDTDLRETETFQPGANPFGYNSTVGDEDSALDGKKEACFEETSDNEYIYYRVLLPR